MKTVCPRCGAQTYGYNFCVDCGMPQPPRRKKVLLFWLMILTIAVFGGWWLWPDGPSTPSMSASKSVRPVTEVKPNLDTVPSWKDIETALARPGGIGNATNLLERLIDARAPYPYAERLLANLYFQHRQYGKAVGAYRRYLSYSEEDVRAKHWLAKSLMRCASLDDASAVIRDVLETHPNYAQAWDTQADIFHAQGHKNAAAEAMKTAAQLRADNAAETPDMVVLKK